MISDFSKNLMRERWRYQFSRRDVERQLGVLQHGELVRRWEQGETVPDKSQFYELWQLMPRLMAYPPQWPGLIMKFGFDVSAEQRLLSKDIADDLRTGKRTEPERPRPLKFAEGFVRVMHEEGVSYEVLAKRLHDSYDGEVVERWAYNETAPSDEELRRIIEMLPQLGAAIEVGAVMRPRPPQKESDMHQIQPVHDKPIKQQLAELIQRARVARDRSHRDLANKCNVSQEVVRSWETGETIPKGNEWAKLKANLFQLGAAQLVWREAIREQAAREVDASNFGQPTEVQHSAPQRVAELVKEEELEEDRAEALFDLPKAPDDVPPPPPVPSASAQPSFGDALRVARVNLGFTQEELGDLVDVGGSTISTWETELSMPTADNWRRLVNALPELKECTPPGLREVRYDGRNGGPRFARARTQDPVLAGRVAPSPVAVSAVQDQQPMSADMQARVAQVGVEYVQALREQRVAEERLRRANEELERAKRGLSAAKTRAEEAQRALVKFVDGGS